MSARIDWLCVVLGAALLAPVGASAQTSSGVVRPTVGAAAQTGGQREALDRLARCPTGCPLDPALAARLDAMDQRITTLAEATYLHASDPTLAKVQGDVIQLKKDVAELRKKLDETKKQADDTLIQLTTLKMTEFNNSVLTNISLASKVSADSVGSQKMSVMACTGLSCMPIGQADVVVWKKK